MPEPTLAAPDTRLGFLQRGHGAGFLAALDHPADAREDVLHCVRFDPRIDRQLEDRARYDAELALRIKVPVEAIVQLAVEDDTNGLAIDVLAWLAVRGDPVARALTRDTATRPEVSAEILSTIHMDWPEWLLDSSNDADLTHLAIWKLGSDRGIEELIADRDGFWSACTACAPAVRSAIGAARAWAPTTTETRDRTRAQIANDVVPAELARIVLHGDHSHARLAAKRLGALGDPRLLDAAEQAFALRDDDAQRLDGASRQRRAALLAYVGALPPSSCLPLARRWHGSGGFFTTVVGRVVAAHAEASDRAWIEEFIQSLLPSDSGWTIASYIDALTRIGDIRSVPLLADVARNVDYSWTRRRALECLARHPTTEAATTAIRDALWDADEQCCELACRHAALDPRARARVHELANDGLLYKDLRSAATARMQLPASASE